MQEQNKYLWWEVWFPKKKKKKKLQESSKIHLATKIHIYIWTLQAWSAFSIK